MLETSATKPFCSCCQDFHYLVRPRDGKALVCPQCSCSRCQRLKDVHPDLGGCTCNRQEKTKALHPSHG